MENNNFCVNTLDVGSIWGKLVNWIEINKIARSCGAFVSNLKYCGNYMDYKTKNVYAIFYTEETNYFIQLEK